MRADFWENGDVVSLYNGAMLVCIAMMSACIATMHAYNESLPIH